MKVHDFHEMYAHSCFFFFSCLLLCFLFQLWQPAVNPGKMVDWPCATLEEANALQHDKTAGVYYIDRRSPAIFLGADRIKLQEAVPEMFPECDPTDAPHDSLIDDFPNLVANLALFKHIPLIVIKRTQAVLLQVSSLAHACFS